MPPWLSASKALPSCSEPSPITATALRPASASRPRQASAKPMAVEMLVPPWPVFTVSYGDSAGSGKPDRPCHWRRVAKRVAAAGEQLVRVALVADVPHQLVALVELVLGEQRQGQLDDAEAGAEVAAGAGDRVDDEARGSRRRARAGRRRPCPSRRRARRARRATGRENRPGSSSASTLHPAGWSAKRGLKEMSCKSRGAACTIPGFRSAARQRRSARARREPR